MGLAPSDRWVWDFWTADPDGPTGECHLFFLQAPRTLGDPDLRHTHASVGHAVSSDLVTWRERGTVLEPSPGPAYDDLATWTGSVVRGDDGRWRMFASGISRASGGAVQGVGLAVADDATLDRWTREPVRGLDLDSRWYRHRPSRPDLPGAPDEHWRDPFVVRDGAGGWHCYLTAQSAGPEGRRGHGVVGHATSPDLATWTVRPPLSLDPDRPGRFDQLEVMSLARVAGRWVLVFSCLAGEVPGARPGGGGVWSVAVEGPGAPVDLDRAVRLTSEDLYVGRVLEDRDGRSVLLAFENADATPDFPGRLVDPVPVAWRADGAGLELAGDAVVPHRWRP